MTPLLINIFTRISSILRRTMCDFAVVKWLASEAAPRLHRKMTLKPPELGKYRIWLPSKGLTDGPLDLSLVNVQPRPGRREGGEDLRWVSSPKGISK
jgi:hypothetical protein